MLARPLGREGGGGRGGDLGVARQEGVLQLRPAALHAQLHERTHAVLGGGSGRTGGVTDSVGADDMM